MWRSPATDPARIDRLLVIFAWKRTQACAPSTCHNRSPAHSAAFQSNNPKAKASRRVCPYAMLRATGRLSTPSAPAASDCSPASVDAARRAKANARLRPPRPEVRCREVGACSWAAYPYQTMSMLPIQVGTRRKCCVGRWCDDGLGPGGLSRLNVGPVVLLILLRVDLLPLRVGH